MKRLLMIVTIGILAGFTGYVVFADQHEGKMGQCMMQQQGKDSCPMGSCPMCPMMCKAMMDHTLAATSDGGVVLMAGCKLIKFDKDLNKIKEVEIQMDVEAMQNKMMGMMKNCPVCKMMKSKMGEKSEMKEEKPMNP
jgi:hypothetical protein